jgi:pilus assembly protein Flp/PilA
MRKMLNLFNRIRREEEGQSMVEYGLIVVLIAVVVIIALTAIGGNLTGLFNNIAGHL